MNQLLVYVYNIKNCISNPYYLPNKFYWQGVGKVSLMMAFFGVKQFVFAETQLVLTYRHRKKELYLWKFRTEAAKS